MSIDVSKLPTPEVVTQLSADEEHALMVADYEQRMADRGTPVTLKVGDPMYDAFLTAAHRLTTARQEFQDISLNNMVAFATGANLQHLAALRPVEKEEGETEERFRRRVQLAPEGFSTAGPLGAYIKHALDADSRVLDAWPDSPNEGDVHLYLLSTEGSGTASSELQTLVQTYVGAETKRPLNDPLDVRSAQISEYSISVRVHLDGSLGEAEAIAAATAALQALVADSRKLGRGMERSAIYAAAHVAGVRKVEILAPGASIEVTSTGAAYCTGISVVKA